jgi:3-deoxy-D-manno-octulosonate 8-phosphate phosphatase (KDO 8-P phosphatase)
MNLLNQLSGIDTFVFDVDGVMTDGSLIILPGGEYVRTLNIKDGYALQLAVKKGYNIIIITGSFSAPVAERLAYLGIRQVHQRVKNKAALLTKLMQQQGLQKEQVLFMGDDMPDFGAMQVAGVAACPADAVSEIKAISQYIAAAPGGRGCVREVVEKVMKLQNKWPDADDTAAI